MPKLYRGYYNNGGVDTSELFATDKTEQIDILNEFRQYIKNEFDNDITIADIMGVYPVKSVRTVHSEEFFLNVSTTERYSIEIENLIEKEIETQKEEDRKSEEFQHITDEEYREFAIENLKGNNIIK